VQDIDLDSMTPQEYKYARGHKNTSTHAATKIQVRAAKKIQVRTPAQIRLRA
jgi:hypothetical protein